MKKIKINCRQLLLWIIDSKLRCKIGNLYQMFRKAHIISRSWFSNDPTENRIVEYLERTSKCTNCNKLVCKFNSSLDQYSKFTKFLILRFLNKIREWKIGDEVTIKYKHYESLEYSWDYKMIYQGFVLPERLLKIQLYEKVYEKVENNYTIIRYDKREVLYIKYFNIDNTISLNKRYDDYYESKYLDNLRKINAKYKTRVILN